MFLTNHDKLQALLKSYKVTGPDPAKPDKFLAYMVPSPDEVDMLSNLYLYIRWILQTGCPLHGHRRITHFEASNEKRVSC